MKFLKSTARIIIIIIIIIIIVIPLMMIIYIVLIRRTNMITIKLFKQALFHSLG